MRARLPTSGTPVLRMDPATSTAYANAKTKDAASSTGADGPVPGKAAKGFFYTASQFVFERLPYTPRAAVTFIAIECVVGICYLFASFFVLPMHPRLHVFGFSLPVLVTLCLHRTLDRRAISHYDVALQTRLSATGMSNATVTRCQKCNALRAARTHHCRKCNRCIPRMSHHCGVLGVCIGGHNHKAFLLLLLYAAAATGILMLCTVRQAARDAVSVMRGRLVLTPALVLRLHGAYLQYALTGIVTALLLYHLRILSGGWTALEAILGKVLWQVVLPEFAAGRVPVSPFDRGSGFRNLAEVFGNGLVSLWPVTNWDALIGLAYGPPDYTV